MPYNVILVFGFQPDLNMRFITPFTFFVFSPLQKIGSLVRFLQFSGFPFS